ncbi:hypothetical protein F5146DRAFT_896611, partial [Armillaria mellea]
LHDVDGSDIPIINICIDLDKEMVGTAIDYWVSLSVNKWTKEECKMNCVSAKAQGHNPCFYQVNQCIRALLLNEKVGYI